MVADYLLLVFSGNIYLVEKILLEAALKDIKSCE